MSPLAQQIFSPVSSTTSGESKASSTATTNTTTCTKIISSTASRETDCLHDSTNWQIFLGGSCNPTTWRQRVAIPFLELNGITYYNPQVENWTPEVVKVERHAKQNAQVLLFVIDKQTRSTVSLVESAFMAAENRNLVLVIYPFDYDIISLTDTSRRSSNIIEIIQELKKTRLATKSKSSSIMKSTSSSSSARIISSTPREGSSTRTSATHALSMTTAVSAAKVSNSIDEDNYEIDQRSLEAVHEEAQQVSGTISMNGELISLGEFQELKQARFLLQCLVAKRSIPMFTDIIKALNHVTRRLSDSMAQQFSRGNNHSPGQQPLSDTDSTCAPSMVVSTEQSDDRSAENLDITRDIYLSLDGEDCANVESLVLPILKEKGLTFASRKVNAIMESNPPVIVSTNTTNDFRLPVTQDETNRYSTKNSLKIDEAAQNAIENEICTIKSSRVLLFVISNKCRGLSVMVLASHFMALFKDNVVLCIQYLEEPCSIGGETLTKTAVADYNRGRVYLCDYAIKSQVPVFSTIREAIDYCSRKCGYNNIE